MKRALPLLPLACLALASLSPPSAARADVVAGECGWVSDMRNIVEPWEENTRTFYQGKVRVALIDSIEPGCCSMHVVVLLPETEDPMGGRRCFVVNQGQGFGFGLVDFQALRADYDPATGLALTIPYALFDPETSGMGPRRRATVQVNLTTGQVRAY